MTVTRSVDELLAGASSRERLVPADARSGAVFERVVVGPDRYFVKRFGFASDWVMRVSGDRVCRQYLVWQAGIMDRSPECVDHTVVAMGLAGAGEEAVLTIVMRDIAGLLVPPGDAILPAGQHAGFITNMAALHRAFWGFDDQIGLTTMAQRVRLFAPEVIAAELSGPAVPTALAAAAAGWDALPGRSPMLSRLARLVHDRPQVITEPLAETPRTFLPGDWKLGNLGAHPDGRTILVDWTLPGAGPACWELCWYLALNRARLPEPKEAVIDRFRAALEQHGIDTDSWWQRQLDLCMIGIMATFGWEKALGDTGELAWWESAAADAATRQGIPTGGSR
jgi:hypothetical protein